MHKNQLDKRNAIRTLPLLAEALMVSVSTAPGQSEMQATLCFFNSVPMSAAIRSHYKLPVEENPTFLVFQYSPLIFPHHRPCWTDNGDHLERRRWQLDLVFEEPSYEPHRRSNSNGFWNKRVQGPSNSELLAYRRPTLFTSSNIVGSNSQNDLPVLANRPWRANRETSTASLWCDSYFDPFVGIVDQNI